MALPVVKFPCDFSRLGHPILAGQVEGRITAFIESFNGKLRADCLNAHWFLSLDDARAKKEEWRKDYNTIRPPLRSATSRRYRS